MCARESALWVIDETLVLIAIIVAICQPLRAIPQGDLSDEALHSLPRAVHDPLFGGFVISAVMAELISNLVKDTFRHNLSIQ